LAAIKNSISLVIAFALYAKIAITLIYKIRYAKFAKRKLNANFVMTKKEI
jgi:hypothetical protein